MKPIKYIQRKLNDYLNKHIDNRVNTLMESNVIASFRNLSDTLDNEIHTMCSSMIRDSTGYLNDYDLEEMTDDLRNLNTSIHDIEVFMDSTKEVLAHHENQLWKLKNPSTGETTNISMFSRFELKKTISEVLDDTLPEYTVVTASTLKRKENE